MKQLLGFALIVFVSTGSNWPQFRGPFSNGSSEETGLPSKWSQTENIAWTANLPGASAATPIVWEEHVFVSSTDASNDSLRAMCFDRRNGKLRWQREIAKGLRRDTRSNFASPTPATDGEVVVFFYGNGPLIAYDYEGKELWSRNVEDDFGQFAFLWTFSTSPILYEGKLILQVLQRDVAVEGRGFTDRKNESYLLALEPKTGEVIWRHVRPSQARAESLEAFSTPVPFEYNGRKELLVVGGDDLTGHDPETGAELWRWGTWNPSRIGHWRLVPSPIASGETILVCAPKSDPVYAIRAGGDGQLNDDWIAWTSEGIRELTSDVPTPAFYDGDFFVLSKGRKLLSRVDPSSGETKWTTKMLGRREFESSPLCADGKIYMINFDGEVYVVNANDGSVENKNEMGGSKDDSVRSSIVASHGQLFIRTNDKLYCVGR